MKKYEQVADTLREAILSGALEDKLPSLRQTMKIHHVSKTTAENAYALLEWEGCIETRPGSGCYVSMDENTRKLKQKLRDVPAADPAPLYDLRPGIVLPDLFDVRQWKRYLKEILEEPDALSSYGDPQGEPALRHSLAQYVLVRHGIVTSQDHIVIGPSYQSLLMVLCQLMEPGILAVEETAPAEVASVFVHAGWQVVTTTCFEEGIPPCDLVYAGPQSARDLSLYADRLVAADNYNRDLLQDSRDPFAGIHLGSFSNVLVPSLRLAYMILPDVWMQRLKQLPLAPFAGKMEQLALARYISDGKLYAHLKKIRKQYRLQKEAACRILDTYSIPYKVNDVYLCLELEAENEAAFKKAGIACGKQGHRLQFSYGSLQGSSLESAFRLVAKVQSGL